CMTFGQVRDAEAYALCNFTRRSTSVTELPDGLSPLLRADAFVSGRVTQPWMAGMNYHSSMSAAMQPVMTSQRRMNRSGAGRL
ncbi:hypothetical protein QMN99_25455, partial [Klebsiella pneumoniae]|uniref:hypothetical protein n=1 Tax=Klebsiella pneumoniae TaxID=573 RepID=UPI0024AEFBB5